MSDTDETDPPAPPPEAPKRASPPFLIMTQATVVPVPNFGDRLVVRFQLQAVNRTPLSHLMELPGDAIPLLIKQLERICEKYPALTTELSRGQLHIQETSPALDAAAKLVGPDGKKVH